MGKMVSLSASATGFSFTICRNNHFCADGDRSIHNTIRISKKHTFNLYANAVDYILLLCMAMEQTGNSYEIYLNNDDVLCVPFVFMNVIIDIYCPSNIFGIECHYIGTLPLVTSHDELFDLVCRLRKVKIYKSMRSKVHLPLLFAYFWFFVCWAGVMKRTTTTTHCYVNNMNGIYWRIIVSHICKSKSILSNMTLLLYLRSSVHYVKVNANTCTI